MAVSIVAVNRICTYQEDAAVALRHHTHTLRLVSARLSGKDAVTIENIAAVLMLSHYEHSMGQYRRGLVHLNGLLRMLEIRGGIAELARINPNMAQKIFRYDAFVFFLTEQSPFP